MLVKNIPEYALLVALGNSERRDEAYKGVYYLGVSHSVSRRNTRYRYRYSAWCTRFSLSYHFADSAAGGLNYIACAITVSFPSQPS